MRGRDGEIHVRPEPPRELGDQVEALATLGQPGQEPATIRFRLPQDHAGRLAESADPFVLASLFVAMRDGRRLRVHGPASASLLRNLEQFQTAWHRWRPDRYHPVAVIAEDEVDRAPAGGDAAILAFSGGLDSCFSAWRHARANAGSATRPLAAAVMVHGFDIPFDQPAAFAVALENSRRILDSIDLELIPVASNVRAVGSGLGVDWEDSHGALIASCLHLVGGGSAAGLIASTHPFDALRLPWGSNPVTDPMLSSTALAVTNDGGGYNRIEKAAEVAGWPEAMRRLRVCWQGPLKDRNCGECPRCVHTALCFAVEGVEVPESIPLRALETAAAGVGRWPLNANQARVLRELVATARARGIGDPWVGTLARASRVGRLWGRLEGRARWLAGPRRAWKLLRSPTRDERVARRAQRLARMTAMGAGSRRRR